MKTYFFICVFSVMSFTLVFCGLLAANIDSSAEPKIISIIKDKIAKGEDLDPILQKVYSNYIESNNTKEALKKIRLKAQNWSDLSAEQKEDIIREFKDSNASITKKTNRKELTKNRVEYIKSKIDRGEQISDEEKRDYELFSFALEVDKKREEVDRKLKELNTKLEKQGLEKIIGINP